MVPYALLYPHLAYHLGQRFRQHDPRKVTRALLAVDAVHCGLGMALLLALLLGALALPLSGWALQLMQPSAELTGEARAFFHTRLLGLPAALA
ncbi:MASE2 domain-containing protein, partial [Klebsiella pneumoniae]